MLFTRKAQAALKRPTETTTTSAISTPVKEEIHNSAILTPIPTIGSLISSSNNAPTSVTAAASLVSSALSISNKISGGLNQLTPLSASINQVSATLSGKSPKRNARHKRLTEMRSSSPKKSPNRTTLSTGSVNLLGSPAGAPTPVSSVMATSHQSASMPPTITPLTPTSNLSSYQHMPDKFRVYRTNNERDVSESDDDDMSDISGSPCSSCSGFSVSGSGSDYDSSDDDEDDDDEDEDEEKSDPDAEENNTRDRPDIEINDSTTIGGDEQGNNGQVPMSCSGDSDTGNVEADSDTQTRSITRRTPTPLDKRAQNTIRSRQRKRHVTSVQPNTDSSPTLAAPAITTVSAAKATTRSSNKQRTATPTPNNVNNSKTRKSNNNVATAAATTVTTAANNNSKIKLNHASNEVYNQVNNSDSRTQHLLKPPLEPLQLVWAKCRGYPWYPALILDPKTPKGFVYNGVPLPAPPTDVLALRKNYPHDMEVFLVLFFDAKRTWQWLPANKLEILGIDKELDQQKLVESRKPTERKAVKKAYQHALHYQSQVSDLEGQGPDPIM